MAIFLLLVVTSCQSFGNDQPCHTDQRDSPASSRTVYVGTDAGVYMISCDVERGATATVPLFETPEESVRCLGIDRESKRLLVGYGLRGSGLYEHAGGGRPRNLVSGWPKARDAWAIASQSDGSLMIGSQPGDIWHGDLEKGVWTKNGSVEALPSRADWTFVVPPHEAHILSFSQSPIDEDTWLAAIEQGGIIKSQDGGATWRQVSPNWDAHVVRHTKTGSAVAATGEGILCSMSGEDWSASSLRGVYATGLDIDRSGKVFAATRGADGGTLWQSVDEGLNWTVVPGTEELEEPGHGVHALKTDPELADTVYFGAGGSVWLVTKQAVTCLATGLPTVRRILITTARM